MKKVFVVTLLLMVMTVLVMTSSTYAYTINVNAGQESYAFAPIVRYLDASSTWTVSNPSGNVYIITNINFNDDNPNYLLNLDDVYRATFSGKYPIFPLAYTNYTSGYSITINKNSDMLYRFDERAGHSTDFYDTTSLIYSYQAIYDFVNNTPTAINVNDLKINLVVYSGASMTTQEVKDFATDLFTKIWVYWQQSFNYYGVDFGTSDYNDGYALGQSNGYSSGYSQARDQFGRFYQGNFQTADEAYNQGYAQGINEAYATGYDEGYDAGYDYGIAITQPEAYNEGYQDGLQDTFANGIQYWLPSAILIVIIGGGLLYMMKRKNSVE